MDSDTATEPGTVTRPPVRRRRRRRAHAGESAPRLLLEAALIVLSVLLGFAVNEWQQNRADRKLAHSVLANFRREIAQNLATLERTQPRHAQLVQRLEAASARAHGDSAAFDVFAAMMPPGGLELKPLPDAAWQTANTTGAFRLLDYETAAMLSETYLVQRTLIGDSMERLSGQLLSPANFDPAAQRTMLRTEYMLTNELSAREAYLIGVYRQTLAKLPKTGAG
jgi:hypothetical protein